MDLLGGVIREHDGAAARSNPGFEPHGFPAGAAARLRSSSLHACDGALSEDINGDRHQDHKADGHHLHVWRDLEQVQAISDGCDQNGAEQGSPDTPTTTKQGSPPENDGSDDAQLQICRDAPRVCAASRSSVAGDPSSVASAHRERGSRVMSDQSWILADSRSELERHSAELRMASKGQAGDRHIPFTNRRGGWRTSGRRAPRPPPLRRPRPRPEP